MYRLENWYFRKYKNYIMALGNVYDNPRFFDGYFVHTNIIVKITVEDTFFHVLTKSGSNYILPYEDCECRGECLENLKEAVALFGFSDALVEKCVGMREEKERNKNIRI